MNEDDEATVPKGRYWPWVTLGGVVLLAGALQLIPEQPFDARGDDVSVKAQTDISAILKSLTAYAINNDGAYPASLEALVEPDEDGHRYLEGYKGVIPRDPWKRQYHYEAPTPAYPRAHVWSYGGDGKPGGTGDNADIDSEQMLEESR